MHALFWKENLKARYQRCDLGIAVGTALNGCQRKWFRFLLDSGDTRSDTQADVVNTVLIGLTHNYSNVLTNWTIISFARTFLHTESVYRLSQ